MKADLPQNVCAVGLDVGGTKIAGGLVDASGEIVAKRKIPTKPELGGESVLERASRMAEEVAAEASFSRRNLLGVGVGLPELVDPSQSITSSHTIAWLGLPVRDSFSHLGSFRMDSDVRTAALAEAAFGAGRGFETFVYVTVGTGISSCLVQYGRPHSGARGNALILAREGSVESSKGGICPGLLEDVAAGPALVERYNRHSHTRTSLGEDVVSAAESGDVRAREIVISAGASLGQSVGWLVNVLDPESVVIGGGLGLAGGLYWSSLVNSARGNIWADESRNLPIIPAALGNDAGIIGAAEIVIREHPQMTGR